MKIVSLGGVCLFPEHITEIERIGDLVLYEDYPRNQDECIERMDGADITISALIPIGDAVMAANKNLSMICLATTGCDDVDLAAAAKRNIMVCYTPGYATEAVAEHTIGLMLAAARLSFAAANDLWRGLYNPCSYQGKQLKGKTLGIVGMGRIGSMVADIAHRAFGMKILQYDITSKPQEWQTLLKESDVISLHVPLTPQTKHMISWDAFALMKKGVVVVNTARGAIIDEEAFIAKLRDGKIFAAGLDVLSHEPMNVRDPLLSMPQVIVTPHIAFNSDEAIYARSKMVMENIINFSLGKPQNVVEVCQ